jgi:hypothetical protein
MKFPFELFSGKTPVGGKDVGRTGTLNTLADEKDMISSANRAKIACFAVWLIPFVISAFSGRRHLSPSSYFIHFIGECSAIGAAVVVTLVVIIFLKSLENKSPNSFFWLFLLLDSVAGAAIAIFFGEHVQYGYVRQAIAGEERSLYLALFWLPLFKIFGMIPDLRVLSWTDVFFSRVVLPPLAVIFGHILQNSPTPSKKPGSSRKSWVAALVFILLLAGFFVYSEFGSRFRAEKTPKEEMLSSLSKIEYRTVPDTDDTRAALGLLESGDYAGASVLLESAIASGDSTAVAALAGIYEEGEPLGRDVAAANLLFLRGARAGNLEALSGFARTYWYDGKEELLELAADRGDRNVRNMCTLGLYYMQGHVSLRDYLRSERYYRIAAEKGDTEAAWQMAGFRYRGYLMESDLDEAEYWIAQTKQRKDPRGFFHLQADLLLERIERARNVQ